MLDEIAERVTLVHHQHGLEQHAVFTCCSAGTTSDPAPVTGAGPDHR
jgi:hypothetical protein